MVDNDEPVIIVLRVATITKDKEIVNDTCCGWDNDDDNICGKKKKPFLLLGSVNQSIINRRGNLSIDTSCSVERNRPPPQRQHTPTKRIVLRYSIIGWSNNNTHSLLYYYTTTIQANSK